MPIKCQAKKQVDLLTDEELLSEFISAKVSNQLISEYKNIYSILMRTSVLELSNIKEISQAKLHKINCLKEVLKRVYNERREEMVQITEPKDVAAYMQDMEHLQQEEFWIIMLNTKNKIIDRKMISKGTVSASVITAREVFCPAIKAMASNIILVHNHPSGVAKPSKEDIFVTKNIKNVGEIVGINVLDHIIIGYSEYCSMKEENFMNED